MTQSGAVFELQVEPGRAAQTWDGRRHQEKDLAVAHSLRQHARRPLRDRLGGVLPPRAVVPVAQMDEGLAEVLAVTAEVEARHGEQRLDVPLLVREQVAFDLFANRD